MYCSKCGSEISPATSFCATCGQPVSSLAVPSLSPISPSIPQAVAPAPVQYGGVAYAGFWLRFVAYIIDGFISGICFVILLIPLFVLTGAGAALSKIGSGEDISDDVAAFVGVGFVLGFIGIVVLVSWLYYALSESSSWQATVGKKILNLKVTDMSGQPISFARASGRYFAKIITGMIPLLIGYILAGFTEKKQAVHDMIASCLVLRNT
ncbi:MAG TPA: RDD family protein [Candidatus Methylomirabilis sp.]|nr:RDD family protein [Candidatus Methylomirabilis sp.]